MDAEQVFRRYQDLQRYVGWTQEDAKNVASIAEAFEPYLPNLVEDFYVQIERHAATREVITGGAEQIDRLKKQLMQWLRELLAGRYGEEYVARRWRVGLRHVEIGLEQVYTNVAMSRVRLGLHQAMEELVRRDKLDRDRADGVRVSLDKLLDLDLAIIEDAYQSEQNRRNQQIEKMATIGQVAGGVAHELRNPLNVIKTSVYYLLHARHATDEKRAEHLTRIERQVGLADGVITALSNFARLPLLTPEPVLLDSWVQEIVSNMQLASGIEISLEIPANLPPAMIDADQMSIVLRNLIRNARDAMAEGGTLSIVGCEQNEGLVLRVSDTGTGIAPEHLDRVMEPLFTTKARGIGLGLAMARAIVEKNLGHLSVTSQPGRGATFTIKLQACAESKQDPEARTS